MEWIVTERLKAAALENPVPWVEAILLCALVCFRRNHIMSPSNGALRKKCTQRLSCHGSYRWLTQLILPKIMVETGESLSPETLEVPIVGLHSPQTHQTPV